MGIGSKGIRLFDRFALLARLAATDRGEVWSALDEQRHEVVAVELFGTDRLRRADDWRRLTHAHELTERLAHSNVLAIGAPLRDVSTVLIPMQLAAGGDARRLIGAPYYEILPVLIDIAQALRHAHRAGVAHLDLRPCNVLLDESSCALLKGFRFGGGTRQEFNAAVRKDLRDFSLLGSELLGKTAAATRAAPPRLWALFDRVYDASFGATPLSFAEIGEELEASRHDTAPLALAALDLTRPTRAIDVTPLPPPLELEVEAEAETARLDQEAMRAGNAASGAVGEFASTPIDSADPQLDLELGAAQSSAHATSVDEQSQVEPPAAAQAAETDVRDVDPPRAATTAADLPSADQSIEPEFLVLPPTANDESSIALDGIEVPLVLEPAPRTRPIAVPVQVDPGAEMSVEGAAASSSGRALVPIAAQPVASQARRWRWMAAGVATVLVAGALWLSRKAALDAEQGRLIAQAAPAASVPEPVVLPVQPPEAATTTAQTAALAVAAEELAQTARSVSTQLRIAENALNDLDERRARSALLTVRRLDPDNRAIAVGLRRAAAIDGIKPLLADAARAEEARDFARAIQGYSHALALDSKQRVARDGMARVRRTIGDSAYGRMLVDAYVALGAGRLEAARDGFGRALIEKPDSIEADLGLERAEAALTARRLAPLLRQAARYEAAGRWADALREYDEILAIQPDYVLAQQGRQRVMVRVATSGGNAVTGNSGGSFQQ